MNKSEAKLKKHELEQICEKLSYETLELLFMASHKVLIDRHNRGDTE